MILTVQRIVTMREDPELLYLPYYYIIPFKIPIRPFYVDNLDERDDPDSFRYV